MGGISGSIGRRRREIGEEQRGPERIFRRQSAEASASDGEAAKVFVGETRRRRRSV